jgi:hypothetical protein
MDNLRKNKIDCPKVVITASSASTIVSEITETKRIVYITPGNTFQIEEEIYQLLKEKQIDFNRSLIDRIFTIGEFGRVSVVQYQKPLDVRLIITALQPDLLIFDSTLLRGLDDDKPGLSIFGAYLEDSNCDFYILDEGIPSCVGDS